MDIEGAERDGLVGARKTIQQFRPKLAISIYHRKDDYIVLSQLIKEMVPDYKLYLAHHSIHLSETVLYAAPPTGT